jgi:hypothetical protein
VYIHGGTYEDLISPERSGTVALPITYKRYLSEEAIIAGRGLSEPAVVAIGWYPILNDGSNHGYTAPAKSNIVIDGLSLSYAWSQDAAFQAQDGSNRIGHVHIGNHDSQNITIKNCKIYQTGGGRTNYMSDYRQTGIMFEGNGALFENNEIHGMWLGIWLSGAAPRNCIIRNNYIHDNGSSCLDIGSPASTLIQGTLIEQNVLGPTWNEDGIQFEPDYDLHPAVRNCGTIVRQNIFVDIAENCIDLKGAGDVVIEDNVCYGDPGQDDGGIVLDYRDGQYKTGSQTWAQWKDENGDWVVMVAQNRSGGKGFVTCGGDEYSARIIIRNNIVYDNLGAIGPIIAPYYRQYKVYNNTFIGNNRDYTGWNSSYNGTESRDGFQALVHYGDGGASDDGFVFINNFVANHHHGEVSINSPGFSSSNPNIDYNMYANADGARICDPANGLATYFTVDNWKTHAGFDTHSVEVPWDQFVSVTQYPTGSHTQYDFGPKAGADTIAAGTYMTRTTAQGTGTSIAVEDAQMFHDGYGITTGDQILVGNDPVAYTVTDVQAATVLVLDRSTTGITSNIPITLLRTGTQPNVGAMLELDTNPQPPVVTISPTTLTVVKGATASFSVSVTSSLAVTYQWYKNNTLQGGETASTYSFTTVIGDNGATIKCAVTNSVGTTTSSNAVLTVNDQNTSANILRNGDFSDGMTAWSFFSDDAAVTGDVTGGEFVMDVGGSSGTNIQLNQAEFAIVLDTDYRLTFVGYANTSRTVQVLVHMNGTPYSGLGLDQTVTFTTSPQTFTLDFTGLASHADARLRFWFAPSVQVGDVIHIDDVVLAEVVVPPPTSDYDLGYAAGYAAGLATGQSSATDIAGLLRTIEALWQPNAKHPWMVSRPR